MIYISWSVLDLKNSTHFFTKVLSIFDSMATSRLVCNSGVDLIIDMYEIGSKRHNHIFGVDTHVPSNIAIHHDENIEITIVQHLKEFNVEYKLENNIAGQFLKVKDPTGNKIAVWTHHGGIN